MQIKHFVNGEWVEVRQNKLAEAFDHAAAHGSAFESDLYKIATNNQGHVTQATSVTKTDLTNYGLLDTNAVAPVYSDNTTYSTGEFCIYQGKLYKALQDVDHEEFNPSKWEESNLLTATIGGGTVITGEADWNAQQGNLGYIKNKPEIPEGLPSVSAEDNGKTLVVNDGEWTIGSSGTGGSVVYFTVTSNDGGNTFTTNKTFAELKAAYDGGSALICLDGYNYHGCAVCVMPDEDTVSGSGLAFAYGDGSYFINGFRIFMNSTETFYDEVTIQPVPQYCTVGSIYVTKTLQT